MALGSSFGIKRPALEVHVCMVSTTMYLEKNRVFRMRKRLPELLTSKKIISEFSVFVLHVPM